MAYDFEQTHERILKSALSHFTEYGFSGASIRRICTDAGVTNGAFYAHFKSKEDLFAQLVEPVVNGLNELFTNEKAPYQEIYSASDIANVLEQSFSSDRILIRYLYEHADIFRLLLAASSGTGYDDYCDRLAECEMESTMEFLDKCRPYIAHPENITAGVVKHMSFFMVSSGFDSFLNGMTEEETIHEICLSSSFCIAGMKQILGL
ncbi:MAG: TetR/AcrR family transcriptional regulator [Lachnospiraceae bacterium]|nr:TetR/AcrR family transcriptional regulator [Lachnospiraceae bacterium]